MPEAKADNHAQSAYAQVVLDIPTRALDCAYDYLVPTGMSAEIGCCVLVDFANRPALGYITGVSEQPDGAIDPSKIKPLKELLNTIFRRDISTTGTLDRRGVYGATE